MSNLDLTNYSPRALTVLVLGTLMGTDPDDVLEFDNGVTNPTVLTAKDLVLSALTELSQCGEIPPNYTLVEAL